MMHAMKQAPRKASLFRAFPSGPEEPVQEFLGPDRVVEMGQNAAHGRQLFTKKGADRFAPPEGKGGGQRNLHPEGGKAERQRQLPAIPEAREADPFEKGKLPGGGEGAARA